MSRFPVIALTFSFSVALLGLLPTVSMAQNNDEGFQSNENSSITGGGNGDFNPFDLIHNSRLNNGRNADQFNQDTAENIDDAAADYRNSLLLYFQQQKAQEALSETAVDGTEPGVEVEQFSGLKIYRHIIDS